MLTSEQKTEERRAKTFGLVRVFTDTQTIIYLILTYNFSEINSQILFYFIYINIHDICYPGGRVYGGHSQAQEA